MSNQPTSFHDFKWACGHVGPGYCKTCHTDEIERLTAERDRQYDQNIEQIKRIAELEADCKDKQRLIETQKQYLDNKDSVIKGLNKMITKLEARIDLEVKYSEDLVQTGAELEADNAKLRDVADAAREVSSGADRNTDSSGQVYVDEGSLQAMNRALAATEQK